MSIVAGISLIDGVMLAADSRVTYQRRGMPDVHLDCAQKIYPISENSAVGFVGSIEVASVLLRTMFHHLSHRRRREAPSLANWLPRFFRWTYQRYWPQGRTDQFAIMVASVVKNRPNVVAREELVRITNQIAFGPSSTERGWIPDILVRALQSDPSYSKIRFQGTSMGRLYVLRSPKFHMELVPPLKFAAIGSGSGAEKMIAGYHDMIVAGEPGNAFIESMSLRNAINDFLADTEIGSVGGLLPIARLTGSGVEALGYGFEMPQDGVEIKLTFDARTSRWIQRNCVSGKEMRLLHPWEIPDSRSEHDVFDDFIDAFRRFRGEAEDSGS